MKKARSVSRTGRVLSVALATLVSVPDVGAETSWDKIGKAWEEYLEYPSKDNCVALYQSLPNSRSELNYESDANGIGDSLFKNLDMLDYQISVGDRDATRIGFKLLTVADGHFGETLDIILGAIIRVDPQMFLEELHNHRHLIVRLDALVGDFGYPFIDRFTADGLETELRIQALQSVQVDSLMEIRNRCIDELDGENED